MAEESVEEKQRNNFEVGGEYYIPGTWYCTNLVHDTRYGCVRTKYVVRITNECGAGKKFEKSVERLHLIHLE